MEDIRLGDTALAVNVPRIAGPRQRPRRPRSSLRSPRRTATDSPLRVGLVRVRDASVPLRRHRGRVRQPPARLCGRRGGGEGTDHGRERVRGCAERREGDGGDEWLG